MDISSPGIECEEVLVPGHHHHMRLPRLVDQYLPGTSDLQVGRRGSPLSTPLDDMVYLSSVVTVWRVDSAGSHPHQSGVHLDILPDQLTLPLHSPCH